MRCKREALMLVSGVFFFAATAVCHAVESPAPDADRKAILAMLGEFRAGFHFQETVELAADYVRKPGKDTVGYETVILVEDSGRRIVLQHILVDDRGHVTKHWRQDWVYEAVQRHEFSAEQTWTLASLPAATTTGAWTECVYEVSDAPRYCGTGRWNHADGHPTWTSDLSWRPLPRREYTVRSDYNAMAAINRYTITANGWSHEQDNTKVLRAATGAKALVREFGLNTYDSIDNHDFSAGYRYWEKTRDYWARVRLLWQQRLQAGSGLRLKTKVDGMPIIMATFGQAEKVASGAAVTDAEIAAVFDQHTEVVGAGPEAIAR